MGQSNLQIKSRFGSIFDAIQHHRLSKGDYEVIAAGTEHGEMTSVHGALIMIRSDIPQDLSWIG